MTITSEAPSFEATADEPTADKRKLIAAGVAGALVLAAGGWFFLHGSGGSSGPALGLPAGGVVRPAAVKPVTKSAVKPAKKAKATVLPAVSTAKLARDPFKPLYIVPAAPVAGTGTTPTTTSGTGSTSSPGTTTPGTTTPATAAYTLQLVSISGPASSDKVFVFKFGTTTKTVVAAQKFGKYGELVTLNYVKNSKGTPIAALIQVGDDDPKTIRIGEKLAVQ